MAAEIGTQKVINEHSTIGLVVTTDGSISEIPREEYEEAEERVIRELKQIDKPFVVLLNCMDPQCAQAQKLAAELEEQYGVPVLALSTAWISSEEDIVRVLSEVLYQFPVREIAVQTARVDLSLPADHWLRRSLFDSVTRGSQVASPRCRDAAGCAQRLGGEYVTDASVMERIDLGRAPPSIRVNIDHGLFYQMLGETTGLEIHDEAALMARMVELAAVKREYDKIKAPWMRCSATGYGIVMPSMEELTLEEPEIVKQGGRYGVRLRATRPSIHMMKADITTEVSPIVGSEKQSEELVDLSAPGV